MSLAVCVCVCARASWVWVGVLGYKEVPKPKCLLSLWFSHCLWLGLGSATSFQFPPNTRALPLAETRVLIVSPPFLQSDSQFLHPRVSSPVPRPPPLAPCIQASPWQSFLKSRSDHVTTLLRNLRCLPTALPMSPDTSKGLFLPFWVALFLKHSVHGQTWPTTHGPHHQAALPPGRLLTLPTARTPPLLTLSSYMQAESSPSHPPTSVSGGCPIPVPTTSGQVGFPHLSITDICSQVNLGGRGFLGIVGVKSHPCVHPKHQWQHPSHETTDVSRCRQMSSGDRITPVENTAFGELV